MPAQQHCRWFGVYVHKQEENLRYLFLDYVSLAILASVGTAVNPNGCSVKKTAVLCESCLPWEEFKQGKLHTASCRLSSAVFISRQPGGVHM